MSDSLRPCPNESDPVESLSQSEADRPRILGMGVASFVLGLSLLCLPLAGLVPLLMGIASLVKIKESRGKLAGKGFAIAGIILGGAGTLMSCCTGPTIFGLWGVVRGPNTLAAQWTDRANLNAIHDALQAHTSATGQYPQHVGQLINQGYLRDSNPFRALPSYKQAPPGYYGLPEALKPVYRFGDYIFATAGQGDPSQDGVPPEAVLAYSRRLSSEQRNRHVLLGSGVIVYESEAGFRARIATENIRRRGLTEECEIQVDVLDGIP